MPKEEEIALPVVLVGGKMVVNGGKVLVDFVPSVQEQEGDGAEAQSGKNGVVEMDEEERMDAFLKSGELRRMAVSAGARIEQRKKKGKGKA